MTRNIFRLLPCALVLHASVFCIGADYLRDVKPLLKHKCYACHGALKQQAGLRLDTAASLVKGGESGATLTPGKPEESLLIDVLTGDAGFRMPPDNEGSPLTAEEIEVIRRWIAAEAPMPQDEAAQSDPKSWWSYRAIRRPTLPEVSETNWCRNEIDYFVAAQRARHGLPHVSEAPKATWLRRVFLDLIGLPPTRREQQRFLADDSPSAFATVVDDLLSRPQYGERWGRHWMDVWRYSDWYGSRGSNEIRYSQRHIWRWRDWIVASLNDDRGYDQMIREMLAADEIAGGDATLLPATGYLGRNWYKFDRDAWMFETVERTGEAFLALTLRCCRCHDHKFDPVTQEEYYRFRAFFEPHDVRTDAISALTGTQKDATLGQVLNDGIALVYDKTPDAPTFLFKRGDGRFPDKSKPLAPGVPAALGGKVDVHPIDLPAIVWYPILRRSVRETLIKKAELEVAKAEAKLRESQLAMKHATLQQRVDSAELVVAVAEAEWKLARGEVVSLTKRLAADVAKYIDKQDELSRLAGDALSSELAAKVRRAEVEVAKVADSPNKTVEAESKLTSAKQAAENPTGTYTPVGEQFTRTSTGRRAALAQWISSNDNPRTARVAVNHIWSRHFGQPLVATPENFGLNGRQPTHPRLLDWLASQLMADGWRMKKFHKQLVLSATYRMASDSKISSSVTSGGVTIEASSDLEDRDSQRLALSAIDADPENRFLWRMNSRRMEAEVVRDSVLHLASRLDMSMGGPEIPETEGEQRLRRSLYFRNTPNEKMLMLDVFDVADPNACYRREESIVPHQSLAMMNSGLTQDTARMVADQLSREADFVSAAFETVLARKPTIEEANRCRSFLVQHERFLVRELIQPFPAGGSAMRPPSKNPAARARENMILVLFLHNDFVTIR